MNIKIGQVPAEKIPTVWGQIEDGVKSVLDMYDQHITIDEIKLYLGTGNYWLVIATKDNKLIAALICSVEEYYNKKVMFVHVGFGTLMNEWKMPMIDFIKQGAKAMGASEIEWRGRLGFMKAWSDVARIKHVSMVIPVEMQNG